jgi:hydrogenase-4 component F
MRMIRGAIPAMPFTGTMFLLGTFAIAGFPPFSIFMSELLIVIAGFLKGAYLATGLTLFFLALAFSGIIYHFSPMLFGRPPKELAGYSEPLSEKIVFLFLLSLSLILGLVVPYLARDAVAAAAWALRGI